MGIIMFSKHEINNFVLDKAKPGVHAYVSELTQAHNLF
jgi:hypothetical protein